MTIRAPKPKRQLATEIALAIRNGDYRSGEWLRQIDIEERFQAKRFEVRAALAELALRQAVQHVPNRGYRVATHDIEQTRDLLAVRALLEVEAAVLALPHIGMGELEEIGALGRAFEDAIAMGGNVEQSRADTAFHAAIYRHAPNKTLVGLIAEMRDRAGPWPITLWPSHDSLKRSAEEHATIVKALAARDRDALVEAVQRHIVESEPHFARFSAEAGPVMSD